MSIKERLSIKLQLVLWLVGVNWHNPYRYTEEAEPKHRGECTPDFSCCSPSRTSFWKRVKRFRDPS